MICDPIRLFGQADGSFIVSTAGDGELLARRLIATRRFGTLPLEDLFIVENRALRTLSLDDSGLACAAWLLYLGGAVTCFTAEVAAVTLTLATTTRFAAIAATASAAGAGRLAAGAGAAGAAAVTGFASIARALASVAARFGLTLWAWTFAGTLAVLLPGFHLACGEVQCGITFVVGKLLWLRPVEA